MKIEAPAFLRNLMPSNNTSNNAAQVAPQSTTSNPEAYNQDQLSAGFFKRFGNGVGEMMSDMSYSLGMGEIYRLVEREFQQVDINYDGSLNRAEFTVATLNPFEFDAADRNYDNRIDVKEYAKYRKDRLEASFDQKDQSRDSHLNIAEIGSVGRIYMANRDPRLDNNLDGLVNKREYVKANLTLGISIRGALGF
mgnify:CR=1 FL=1